MWFALQAKLLRLQELLKKYKEDKYYTEWKWQSAIEMTEKQIEYIEKTLLSKQKQDAENI